MSNPVFIGVDPAFRAGGFWACEINRTAGTVRFVLFSNVLEWYDRLKSWERPPVVFIAVENSNEQNASFDMTGTKAEVARKARNVGTNQAVSQLAVDAVRIVLGGGCVWSVSPEKKGAKWDEKTAQAVAKSEGLEIPEKTNQDQRDAFKLALMSEREFSARQKGFYRPQSIEQ